MTDPKVLDFGFPVSSVSLISMENAEKTCLDLYVSCFAEEDARNTFASVFDDLQPL
jgi:hypothetical protein